MREINYIIVHCSASRADVNFGVQSCREYHMGCRHYSDIGYHWYIEKDGSIKKGRPEGKIGAHCYGHNKNSIGVCYEGGLASPYNTPSIPLQGDRNPQRGGNGTLSNSPLKGENSSPLRGGWVGSDTRTPEQKASLLKLLKQLKQRYPNAQIVGHHDFNPRKACPCFNAKEEYRDI